MLHINITSIANKYDDFQAYLESLKYTFLVIGITETWLNKENENNYPFPLYADCSFIGKNRENKQGGGVFMSIKHISLKDEMTCL